MDHAIPPLGVQWLPRGYQEATSFLFLLLLYYYNERRGKKASEVAFW
jgi:hypothetical protein